MKLTSKDITLVYTAVGLALMHRGLSRSQRETFLRLRDRLAPLYREATEAEDERRAARERTAERRSARRMPAVSRTEADDWHAFLSGEPSS
jgi:hypothetical protein